MRNNLLSIIEWKIYHSFCCYFTHLFGLLDTLVPCSVPTCFRYLTHFFVILYQLVRNSLPTQSTHLFMVIHPLIHSPSPTSSWQFALHSEEVKLDHMVLPGQKRTIHQLRTLNNPMQLFPGQKMAIAHDINEYRKECLQRY